jgi:hypothetical protein
MRTPVDRWKSFASPAVNLPTNPPRRVVDAGYYDNYGIQLATAWAQANFDWLLRETSGVLLVQIRDAISVEERLDVSAAPTGFWATLARGFQFFTSPLQGAEQARTASSLFRNDQDVQGLSDLFTARFERWARANIKDEAQQKRALLRSRAFFSTVVFENSAEVVSHPVDPEAQPEEAWRAVRHATGVALDWYLSRAEQESLRKAIMPPLAGMNPAERVDKIRSLQIKVARARGTLRSHFLNQLQSAQNSEQLVRLKEWWKAPGSAP